MTEQDHAATTGAAPYDVGDVVELNISDVAYPGRGVGRLDKLVVFVARVLPGELVRARISVCKKSFAEAVLLEVITPSPQRCEPECPLARTALGTRPADLPVCPGCSYQHMRYKQELRLKDAQLAGLLERLGGGPPEGEHFQPVPGPATYGYRNKVVLHSAVAADGTKFLGYFGEDNRSVVRVEQCPLAAAEINARLRELLADAPFMARLEEHANVTLRHTRVDGVVDWVGKKPREARWLTETTPLGNLSVPVNGFNQVNPAVAALLVQHVQAYIRKRRPVHVIDLYCGCGLFALAAAAANVEAVLGVDSDPRAIQSARYNAHGRRLPQIEFVAAPAARVLKQALAPLNRAESVLIVDPPRSGLEPSVRQIICEAGPNHLLYISCAPDTLARDVRVLRERGYRIESRQVFDMFPRTPHFETLLALTRRPDARGTGGRL